MGAECPKQESGGAIVANGDRLLSVEEAGARLKAVRPPLAAEIVDVADALGRTLAEPVAARCALPPFDRAAMDGYAVRAADVAAGVALPLAGKTLAGEPAGRLAPGAAWRIFTGAPMPAGADAVVEQEAATLAAGGVALARVPRPGRNLMRRGHERRAGAEVAAAGDRLTAAHLGLLAGAGAARVAVKRRLRVAVVEVGSELAPPGTVLAPGHIYGVHRVWVPAAAAEWGGAVVSAAHVRDDAAAIAAAVEAGLAAADLVVTTGGVSVGEADLVPSVLDEIAVPLFWRVAMHPGKAVAAAHRGSQLVMALSGNPGAAYLSAMVLLGPWWAAVHGARLVDRWSTAPLVDGFFRPTREPRYLAVRRTDGGVAADLPQGADMLTTYVAADGLAVVPAGAPAVDPGTVLPLWETPGIGGLSPRWAAMGRD